MEDLSLIQSNIKKYIKSCKDYMLTIPEKYIGVSIKKIGGLSNINYSAVVKDMSTNRKIAKVLYRKFGALSDSVNHELEVTIIKEITEFLNISLELQPFQKKKISTKKS